MRRELDGTKDAEHAIAILNRRLQPVERVASATWEGDIPSGLGTVLHQQRGTCLGLSLLYLSVAKRAGLPLHGVAAPGHCFVRWDDGKTRRNIETTGKGIEKSDSTYMKEFAITEEDIEAGRYLFNLTAKQVLSPPVRELLRELGKFTPSQGRQLAICKVPGVRRTRSRSGSAITGGLPGAGRGGHGRGPGTGGRGAQGHRARAGAGPNEHPPYGGPSPISFGRWDAPEEAMAEYDQVLKWIPGDPEATIARLDLLLRLGRVEQARVGAETYLERCPESRDARMLRLETLVRLRDPRWAHRAEDPHRRVRRLRGAPSPGRTVAAAPGGRPRDGSRKCAGASGRPSFPRVRPATCRRSILGRRSHRPGI